MVKLLLEFMAIFGLFMVVTIAINAIDRQAGRVYGYYPFALPNLAFMLIPHLLLAGLLFSPELAPRLPDVVLWGLAGLAVVCILTLFSLILWRTNGLVAGFATIVMLVGASILMFTVLFRILAEDTDRGGATGS